MRFEDAYEGWTEKRLTQIDAARLLGVCPRTFRRTINRYEEGSLAGHDAASGRQPASVGCRGSIGTCL